ncbi:MAG: hypothetical protein ACRDVE_04390 [Actinocrinis sp.]
MTDSGIGSVRDLHAILPAELRERVTPDMVGAAAIAAALRLLATMLDTSWQQYVTAHDDPYDPWASVDWASLLTWARRASSPSVQVRAELAASLAGFCEARPQLLAAAHRLDRRNFEAFLDALRIAREGVTR